MVAAGIDSDDIIDESIIEESMGSDDIIDESIGAEDIIEVSISAEDIIEESEGIIDESIIELLESCAIAEPATTNMRAVEVKRTYFIASSFKPHTQGRERCGGSDALHRPTWRYPHCSVTTRHSLTHA